MKLSEILSISGSAGLYKYVAQSKGGFIVESLSAEAKRMNVSGTAKVSSLGDIAMFTYSTDVPLGEVLDAAHAKFNGETTGINSKSTPEELAAFMESVLPEYDKSRVHNSDIKKLAQWYEILAAAGMTSFTEEEEESGENATAPKASAATVATKTAANKVAQNKGGATTSKSKVTTTKSTTARKAQ